MTKPTLRCAIYTRVSSDQGLEQDFNSLDAQREAAEAYIKSQAHEGWRLRRDHYDDGGFSGGSMERPALQKLLADIVEGRIDVVVVYKVDRLTRSLADFAKLVELFDSHKVSFVSVTQSFNTTSSMGRLTLNVLLSFAQFEREVTGERIRDKIAASKRKGLWMGGVVPLGYRVEARKLWVDEPEAVLVRRIFARYLELGSLPALQRELREEGIRSRSRQLASGKLIGDVFLTNGPLAYILKNRHYLGELNHKGKSYPGDHASIIPVDLFEAVQRKLAENLNRRDTRRSRSEALLPGKIFDDRGNRMSPSHALKKGVRYRYYVSSPVVQGRKEEAGLVKRVPAVEIEKLVIGALRDHASASQQATKLTDKELVETRLGRAVICSHEIEVIFAESPEAATSSDRRHSGADESPRPEETSKSIRIAWTPQPHRRTREIILPEQPTGSVQPIRQEERLNLLKAIALGRKWLDDLIEGTCPDMFALAKREGKTERSIRMFVSLAFLDPTLVKAAAEGRLPRGYGLSRMTGLPMAWPDQWRALGLPQPI
jgi:DNA invertase Pin-like site-specific DNA recombinase